MATESHRSGDRTRFVGAPALIWMVVACGKSTTTVDAPEPADAASDGAVIPEPETEPPRRSESLAVQSLDVDPWPLFATDFVFLPDSDNELIVTDNDGPLLHYRIAGDALELLGTVEVPDVYTDLDCGVISIALDPDFEENGWFYLGLCTSQQDSGIYRFRFDGTDYDGIAGSRETIFEAGDERAAYPWHNVGWIGFDSEGALMALFGDKVIDRTAQDPSNALGSVIRILPRDEGGFDPAPGNPAEADDSIAPEVYAWGLRSPWRGGFDSLGRLWVGDVGVDTFDEVNLVTAPAQNFGWATHEGPCEDDCEGFADAAFIIDRSSSHRYIKEDPLVAPVITRSVWVAPEQYDPSVEDRYDGLLDGRMLFGDACAGFTRSAWVDEDGQVASDDPVGHLGFVSSIRQGPDGYLYATRISSCLSDVPRPGGSFGRVILADAG